MASQRLTVALLAAALAVAMVAATAEGANDSSCLDYCIPQCLETVEWATFRSCARACYEYCNHIAGTWNYEQFRTTYDKEQLRN